jgi:GGDEF domain-containing protein
VADVEGVKGRIQRFVEDWNQSEHLKNFRLSLSVGFSQWAHGKTADEILNEADQQMYAIKARSKESRSPAS